ncbi:hypothetical protein [Streptomyces sp. NPDC024089]|uniref:hypothetical protein n=1 Tax=Streptomyces sp. NPDC024089 TaxID=3154328 RepID=UPI0033E46523
MLATAIAVLGTLLGTVVAGAFQQKSAGRAATAAATEQLRRERLAAVTELAAAAADHQLAMWMRGEAQFSGATPERVEELRSIAHATRSAITRPLVAVQVLIPDPTVRAAAHDMVAATYWMRDADTSTEALVAAQTEARASHDRFVDAAAAYLTTA